MLSHLNQQQMSNFVLEQLENLREKYRKGLVSVIVGAGFSRNACEEYPSWKELLLDMVVELYKDDIESSFIRYLKINPGTKMSLDAFTKIEVPKIIGRVGYLKMVSEYIARKGYREAIEHYIEERVPYIDTNTQQFKFAGKNKGKVIDIKAEKFSAHKKLLEGEKWERIYTTNYDRLLEYAKDIGEKKYSVIKKARDLSVSKETPSIIKLHGDLYNPKEKRVFMFDGNPHQQYIISEEDYRNYPKEHEAFTQLMRISLLQGAFCLVGFSGDDPNFINWISWVRDVIVKEEDNEKNDCAEAENAYKIFLIGLAKDEPDEIRKIFYDNHNIVFIPLLRDDVKEEIDAMGLQEPRDLFCKFFAYLYKEKRPSESESASDETPNSKAYNDLWGSIYKVNYNTDKLPLKIERNITIDEKQLEQLFSLKPWNRIVTYTYNQTNFLKEISYKQSLTINEAKLALLAVDDTGMPVDNVFIRKVAESGIGTDYIELLNKHIERTKTLMCSVFDDETKDVGQYELILRSLFVLDFKRAKELLDNWNPTGADIIKKTVLISTFNKSAAKEMLEEYIKQEPNIKEQYYATRMLNLIENTYPWSYSLDRFVNANVQDYYKAMSTLAQRTNEKKEKIGRYGDGKNEKIHYIGWKPTKIVEATALLHFMIEAPAFVSWKNFITLLDSWEWYHVHKNIFERYPLPTLYYGLQCTDSKIKTRIGQDYSYSDNLVKDCLDDIIIYLLKAYLAKETPNYLKESILIITKELFVSVKPSKWEGLFMQIWDEVVLKYRFGDNKNRFDELDHFVGKALLSLKTLTCRQKIIQDVLMNAKKATDFAIECLYYLRVKSTDMKGNKEIQKAVNMFVDEINTPAELNVAGNIYRLLSKEQFAVCAQKCMILLADNEKAIESIVYRASQYFLKDNNEGRSVFIKSICENPLLWNNGVNEDGSYSDSIHLKISEFTRRIYIDQASLIIIFNKLKHSAEDLMSFVERHNDISFFSETDGVLSEMLIFLNYYEKRLQKEKGYYDLRERISQTYQNISGLSSVEDGLLSEYENDVAKSLKYIEANHDIILHKELIRLLNTIINRVLMKNSDGIDLCISYLRIYLQQGIITMEDENLVHGLLRILDHYEKDDVQRCNMDLVVTAIHLGHMAVFLAKKGLSSKGIDYWKRFKKTARFYTNFS